MRSRELRRRLLTALFVVVMFNVSKAQLAGSSSPIFGSSPFNSADVSLQPNRQLVDPNWGILPSQQNRATDIWGRTNNNSRSLQRTTQPRDIYGNIVLTDPLGNVLYDAQGNAIVDTSAMQGVAPNDLLSLPPPPPDPLDVPIDSGVIILLILATGLGYKRKKLITAK